MWTAVCAAGEVHPGLGDRGAPVTTVAVLVAAAVAALAGFVVLRSITDQVDGSENIVGSDDAASDVGQTALHDDHHDYDDVDDGRVERTHRTHRHRARCGP